MFFLRVFISQMIVCMLIYRTLFRTVPIYTCIQCLSTIKVNRNISNRIYRKTEYIINLNLILEFDSGVFSTNTYIEKLISGTIIIAIVHEIGKNKIFINQLYTTSLFSNKNFHTSIFLVFFCSQIIINANRINTW